MLVLELNNLLNLENIHLKTLSGKKLWFQKTYNMDTASKRTKQMIVHRQYNLWIPITQDHFSLF